MTTARKPRTPKSVVNRDENLNTRDESRQQGASQKDFREENLAMTAEERRSMLRNEWLYEALPRPPNLPGFHTCWLSSTNQWDPIQKRIRMGYSMVGVEECPEFDHMKVHSAAFEGGIAVNEMVLFKIPLDIYNEIMLIQHHEMPLEQELALASKNHQFAESLQDSKGKSLIEIEGDENVLVNRQRKPVFSE